MGNKNDTNENDHLTKKTTDDSDNLGKLDINYDVFDSKPKENTQNNDKELDSFDKKIRDLNL